MIRLRTRILFATSVFMLLAACGAESISDNSISNNDRDSDGIIDSIDKCPDTLAGEIPGSDGCVYIEVAMANNILVGGAGSGRPGYTLYVFDDDQGTTGSSCNDSCADTWPPLLVSDGFASGIPKLTTVVRDDGLAQAAFDGRPLYFFTGDNKTGDTNGQGLNGAWWPVDYVRVFQRQ